MLICTAHFSGKQRRQFLFAIMAAFSRMAKIIVHKGQKPLTLEVQPSAYFLDRLDPRQPLRHHELFQHFALIRQVRLLRRARYPTVGDQLCWRMARLPQTDELTDLRLSVEAAVTVRSGHRN